MGMYISSNSENVYVKSANPIVFKLYFRFFFFLNIYIGGKESEESQLSRKEGE